MLNTRSVGGDINAQLYLGNTQAEAASSQLVVRGPDGKLLFLVGDSDVVVATDKLRVNSKFTIIRFVMCYAMLNETCLDALF